MAVAWSAWIPPNVLARAEAWLRNADEPEVIRAAERCAGFPAGDAELIARRFVRAKLADGGEQLRPVALIRVRRERARAVTLGYCAAAGGMLVEIASRGTSNRQGGA